MSNGDGVMQIGGYARRVDQDEFQHAAPAGCPVWRAKLGSACAGDAKPIVR